MPVITFSLQTGICLYSKSIPDLHGFNGSGRPSCGERDAQGGTYREMEWAVMLQPVLVSAAWHFFTSNWRDYRVVQ